MRLTLVAASMAALLAACGGSESVVIGDEDAQSAYDTDDQRVLYSIGIRLGENIGASIAELRLSEEEISILEAGIRDEILGRDHAVDINVYGPMIQEFAERRIDEGLASAVADVEAEKAAAVEFADTLAAEPGAERSPSGLVYVPVVAGEGPMPDARDTVMVHYHGTLRDGTVFDSSRDRGEPVSFGLNQVIPCWTEGVQMMQVGGTAKLLCPSEIAYGDGGVPGDIPGGAALLFEVELIEIVE